jgi:hypothetical protein
LITSIYVCAGHTLAGAEKFEFIRIDAGVNVTLNPGEDAAAATRRVQPDIRKMLEETYRAQVRKKVPPPTPETVEFKPAGTQS